MSTTARRRQAASSWAGAVNSDPKQSEIEGGRQLRNYLEQKFLGGELTAVDLVIQSYYTTAAGGKGLEDLAILPAHANKHAAEHVDLILGKKYTRPNVKTIMVAACRKKGCVREKIPCPIRLPTQIMSETYAIADHIDKPGEDPSVLRLFGNHPVVKHGFEQKLHWSRILPLVLYWDGVMYTKRDSFLGLSVTDYRTMKSSLIALFRKGDMCNCGCRGWCTLYPILVEIALNLKDGVLEGFLLATLFTKGDWPAFTDIAGVRQWLSTKKRAI